MCPYTLIKKFLGKDENTGLSSVANLLRVVVKKSGEVKVDVSLPAQSARWLIELIPGDVVLSIKNEGIPLDSIQKELSTREVLQPQQIFQLNEPHRQIDVWLE